LKKKKVGSADVVHVEVGVNVRDDLSQIVLADVCCQEHEQLR